MIYTGPVYTAVGPEDDAEDGEHDESLDDALCPWCIADGSAYTKFKATFVDAAAIADGVSETAIQEICQRTPGYDSWQEGHWISCCGDAAAFLAPVGWSELRATYHEFETPVLSHIIHDLQISGGSARRMLESLDRDRGPTAYLFRCLHCQRPHVHLDYL